jgi:hypothetical protein
MSSVSSAIFSFFVLTGEAASAAGLASFSSAGETGVNEVVDLLVLPTTDRFAFFLAILLSSSVSDEIVGADIVFSALEDDGCPTVLEPRSG